MGCAESASTRLTALGQAGASQSVMQGPDFLVRGLVRASARLGSSCDVLGGVFVMQVMHGGRRWIERRELAARRVGCAHRRWRWLRLGIRLPVRLRPRLGTIVVGRGVLVGRAHPTAGGGELPGGGEFWASASAALVRGQLFVRQGGGFRRLRQLGQPQLLHVDPERQAQKPGHGARSIQASVLGTDFGFLGRTVDRAADRASRGIDEAFQFVGDPQAARQDQLIALERQPAPCAEPLARIEPASFAGLGMRLPAARSAE